MLCTEIIINTIFNFSKVLWEQERREHSKERNVLTPFTLHSFGFRRAEYILDHSAGFVICKVLQCSIHSSARFF